MVETVTPAVCGSRKRQLAALAFFAVGAIGAAAALGALLGLAGAAIGTGPALVVAAVLAALGALREAGIVRFPIPQSKRQVPDWWRYELPLPVWSAGYGAGLGLGVLTYQPVATFWVACAAAVALGRPLAGAVAFALYGVGRSVILLLPARRGADAVALAERLVGRRRAVLRANAIALAACAVLLSTSPVAGAASVVPLGPGSFADPSASPSGLAYTKRRNGTVKVVVRPSDGGPDVVIEDAESPSLFRGWLAYQYAGGIRVVRWRSGEEVAVLDGPHEKPALDWPWLAYRTYHGHATSPKGFQHPGRTTGLQHEGHERYSLHLRNLKTGDTRLLARGRDGQEIGRPSVGGGRVAWHVSGASGSKIVVYRISGGSRSRLITSKVALHANPALSRSRVIWTRDLASGSTLFKRRLSGGRIREIASVDRPRTDYWFWTTDLWSGRAYVTRWNVARGVARILRERI